MQEKGKIFCKDNLVLSKDCFSQVVLQQKLHCFHCGLGRAPGWLKRNLGAAERGCRLRSSEGRKTQGDAGKRRGSPQRPRAPGRLLAARRRAFVIGARLPGLGPAASGRYSAGRPAARWVSPAHLEVGEMEVSAGRTHGAQIRNGALSLSGALAPSMASGL